MASEHRMEGGAPAPQRAPHAPGEGSRGQTPKLRLGGMALSNGLLVHGPTHWAVAIRARDDSIKAGCGRKPRLRGVDSVPGLRGLARLAEAFAVVPRVKRSLPEAQLPFERPRVMVTMAAAAAFGALVRRGPRAGVYGEGAAALVGAAPALVALRGGELAAYHGVEHKTIAAYEQGSTAAQALKEHDRCGSHLMAPMLVSNLAGTVLLARVADDPGRLAGGALALASAALAVEIFAWSERHAGTAMARLLRRPGYELQRLIGTREPDERQLEVGRAALVAVLRAEGASPLPDSFV